MELKKYQSTNFIIGLRAVAILLVFMIHSGGGGLRSLGDAFSLLVDFGKYGVQMFFVISGFTIFYQFYTSNYDFKKFIFIRIARISIPYFPIIILLYLYVNYGGEANYWANKFCNGNITFENLFLHFVYLASFSVKYANTIIGVEWTLHIEVFYYFAIGLLISINLLQLTLKRLLISLAIFIFIAVIMLYLGHSRIYDPLLIHWVPFTYGWLFILGGLAYYFREIVQKQYSIKIKYMLSNIMIISAIVSIITLLNIKVLNHIGPINEGVFGILTFLLIIFVNDKAKFTKLLINKPMLFLGDISFSFYLWHIIILGYINFDIDNRIILFLVKIILIISVSFIWYYIFETIIYKKVKHQINIRQGKR